MDSERIIRIMKSALVTIAYEAQEPIIRVYAQSALDETKSEAIKIEPNAHCKTHNWYGLPNEDCPICVSPIK